MIFKRNLGLKIGDLKKKNVTGGGWKNAKKFHVLFEWPPKKILKGTFYVRIIFACTVGVHNLSPVANKRKFTSLRDKTHMFLHIQ